MNRQPTAIRSWLGDWVRLWDRFWFSPRRPETVSLMRILLGSVLVYTHWVWTLELEVFLARDGVFRSEYSAAIHGGQPWAWSHFNWSDSPLWLWGSHFAGLAIMTAFLLGLWTRLTSILTVLLVISYAHRASGALFGLDQINGFLALYLALTPCGACYSVDAWLRNRRAGPGGGTSIRATVMTNLGTRLIQLHLCLVYLFAGLGKLQGPAWWEGTAMWGAVASLEYQTVDLTFLAAWPWVINALTLSTLAWECSYPFLIWPRLTRPLWLGMAVLVHTGIGLCMGMITFGLIMIIANLSFVEPAWVRRLAGCHPLSPPDSG